jgi:putative Mn2+ efflux pump MntP
MSGKWLGAGLLIFIGARMVLASFRVKREESQRSFKDPTKGWMLVGLSLATSLDALGVGFGFGLLVSDLLEACLLIGLVAFVLTYLGVAMGSRLSGKVGNWAEGVGGAVLIVLGFRMLIS